MLVYPVIQHSPSCQDSKIPCFESWNLGNLGGNLGQNHFTLGRLLCYIGGKPRGPVTQKHQIRSGCTSTDKRGFVTPKFLGLVRLYAPVQWLRGVVGATRKDVRTASDVFLTTTLHQMHSKMQTVVSSLIPEGTQTMTAITQASRAATPQTAQICAAPTTGTIPASNISAVLAAFNASNLAASYIERGNFAAARRKLTQALASINQIKLEG